MVRLAAANDRRPHIAPALPHIRQQANQQHHHQHHPQLINNEDFPPGSSRLDARAEPLSFERALEIGRGAVAGVGGGGGGPTMGRQLPSPMPNGFKPGQANTDPVLSDRRDLNDRLNRRSASQRPVANRSVRTDERHSDSDEDDWC